MAFKFIYGPNGTDKTEKCMNMIERCVGHYGHIYYVVPEYLSFYAENKVSSLFGGVSEGKVQVTSFKKLYCETVNITGEEKSKKLTAGGVRIVMAYLCTGHRKELGILGKTATRPGFADIMARMVQELKTYNINSQDLLAASEKITDSLKIKLLDIFKIYNAYEEFMAGKFSDAQDELGILKTKISENPEIYENSLFVFDGFQTFTPGQTDVITALAEKSDMAFAFATDNAEFSSGETYLAQNKSINKLRSLLEKFEEKQSETAEKCVNFDSMPENEYILNNLLYGKPDRFEGVPQNIEIHEFADQHQETEFVAEQIIGLVKKGARYRDISVIVRDGARYLPVIESVFKDYEIPVFIDKKLSAANQPAINAVLSALDILNDNFSYESVFSYLKTGFSNLDAFETDLVENYIIATGIRGSGWLNEWKYTPYISKLFGSDVEFLEKINEIREKIIAPLIALKDGLSTAPTVEEKCRAVFNFIKEIKLYEKIRGMVERFKETEPQTAAYYGRVWNLLLKTLDETVEVIGSKEQTTNEFITLFTLGLSMHEISIVPTGVDVVSVVQPENISEHPEKYVFVIGANDGVYPSVMMTEGLLSDRDRTTLESLGIELAQDTISKAFGENYITLKTFLSAEKKLVITYPIGDTGGVVRFVSVMVKRIKDVFPALEIKSHVVLSGGFGDDRIVKPGPAFSKYAVNLCRGEGLSEKWTQAGEWYRQNPKWHEKYTLLEKARSFTPGASNLEQEITDRLYENELNLSVSSLEQYKRCPFAYYANYTLKLRPREKAEISSADSGSLMHEAIEKLSGAIIKNGYSWKSAPTEFLERETVKITDEIITEIEGKFDGTSVRRLRMLARIKEMLEQSVRYIAEHLKAGEFEPLGYEIEFGDGKRYASVNFDMNGKKVRLTGKVDRADIYYDDKGSKYVRVIDYKSGNKNFDYTAMFYGLQIQLVVYLDRICKETEANPAGILYFRLFDPVIDAPQSVSDDDISDSVSMKHKMTGVVLDDEKIINAMDREAKSESRIIPVKHNADGSISKKSSVITSSQFKNMQRHINRLIRKTGEEILKGKTDVCPSAFNGQTGCDYCNFKKICFFDEHCGGKYNMLEKMNSDEVLKAIGKEDAENA